MSDILINLNMEIIYSLENSFGICFTPKFNSDCVYSVNQFRFWKLKFWNVKFIPKFKLSKRGILYYVQRYRFMLVQECKSKNIHEG